MSAGGLWSQEQGTKIRKDQWGLSFVEDEERTRKCQDWELNDILDSG